MSYQTLKAKRIVNKDLIEFVKSLPCIMCNKPSDDAHHVKSKKSGGHDIPENLMPLTRDCHRILHDKGLSRIAGEYPAVKCWLESANWGIVNGKWRR